MRQTVTRMPHVTRALMDRQFACVRMVTMAMVWSAIPSTRAGITMVIVRLIAHHVSKMVQAKWVYHLKLVHPLVPRRLEKILLVLGMDYGEVQKVEYILDCFVWLQKGILKWMHGKLYINLKNFVSVHLFPFSFRLFQRWNLQRASWPHHIFD